MKQRGRALLEPIAPVKHLAALIAPAVLLLGACNRMITPPETQRLKDAEARARDGDFLHAIALYETALEGTAKSADVHYRLALLYDEKMNEPLHALHHFKRYLTLAPNGPRADEVKKFMKRDELALVTSMSGDAIMTHTEAARLRNENLTLHKELEQRAAGAKMVAEKAAAAEPVTSASRNKHGGRTRSYVVQPGDTLASISRKFYRSSAGWKKILDANKGTLPSAEKLKPGQTLLIP